MFDIKMSKKMRCYQKHLNSKEKNWGQASYTHNIIRLISPPRKKSPHYPYNVFSIIICVIWVLRSHRHSCAPISEQLLIDILFTNQNNKETMPSIISCANLIRQKQCRILPSWKINSSSKVRTMNIAIPVCLAPLRLSTAESAVHCRGGRMTVVCCLGVLGSILTTRWLCSIQSPPSHYKTIMIKR